MGDRRVPRRLSVCGYVLVIGAATFSAATCGRPPLSREGGSAPLALIKMWQAPPSAPAEHRYRDDGEGPFPASWPTFAFVAKTEAQQQCRASWGGATLFLSSGSGLAPTDGIVRLVAHARFAVDCRTWPDIPCHGAWVRMGGLVEEEHFVLVDASGGTAGRRVRVHEHQIMFNLDWQDHWFREVFYGLSRLPVYAGDIDADGRDEILLGTEESNSSGAAGTPKVYRIMKWSGTQMEEAGQVDASVVRQNARMMMVGP